MTPDERADIVWKQHMTDRDAAELKLKALVREQIEDALNEQAGLKSSLDQLYIGRLESMLLAIVDDATDGPINRGLNSVQAVLDWGREQGNG